MEELELDMGLSVVMITEVTLAQHITVSVHSTMPETQDFPLEPVDGVPSYTTTHHERHDLRHTIKYGYIHPSLGLIRLPSHASTHNNLDLTSTFTHNNFVYRRYRPSTEH